MSRRSAQRSMVRLIGLGLLSIAAVINVDAQPARDLHCKKCVQSRDLDEGSVNRSKLANGAVTASKIKKDAVNGNKIARDSVPSSDLKNEAGLDFENIPRAGTAVPLDGAEWVEITRIAIKHPSKGYVNCIAMGNVDYDVPTSAGSVFLGWGTKPGVFEEPDSVNVMKVHPFDVGTDRRVPMGAMYTFRVRSKAETTFILKAGTHATNPESFKFGFHGATCMFFPTRY